jgi:hypothetical protein
MSLEMEGGRKEGGRKNEGEEGREEKATKRNNNVFTFFW